MWGFSHIAYSEAALCPSKRGITPGVFRQIPLTFIFTELRRINSLEGLVIEGDNMRLGAFSISLSVKDIQKSWDFYEKLGFRVTGGDISQNWLILMSGDTVLGLFQGMFDGNLLTFNPGWDQHANDLEEFDDIRVLKQRLEEKGLAPINMDSENPTGPASFSISDPDGNVILVDQHR